MSTSRAGTDGDNATDTRRAMYMHVLYGAAELVNHVSSPVSKIRSYSCVLITQISDQVNYFVSLYILKIISVPPEDKAAKTFTKYIYTILVDHA